MVFKLYITAQADSLDGKRFNKVMVWQFLAAGYQQELIAVELNSLSDLLSVPGDLRLSAERNA
jgi:hypothetical protein